MQALISAQQGLAVVVDGRSVLSIHAATPDKDVPRRPHEVRWLLGGADDIVVLEATRRRDVVDRLLCERRRQLGLLLAAAVLEGNPAVTAETRREVAAELEEVLTDARVLADVENVLWSVPAPPAADFDGPRQWLSAAATPQTLRLIEELEAGQPAIALVRQAWDALPDQLFSDSRDLWKHEATRLGLFRKLAETVRQGQPVSFFLIEASNNPQVRGLGGYRAVLREWMTPLEGQRHGAYSNVEASSASTRVSEVREPPARAYGTGKRNKRRKKQRVGVSQALAKVKSMKQRIGDELAKRKFHQVDRLVDELVVFQETNGGSEYAAKSLCDLAQRAKALGHSELHLRWSRRATDLAPRDGWAWAQLGDALLNQGRHGEALNAFSQATLFGEAAIGSKGRAEVLKSLGRLEESLAAYAEVMVSHPENVVAKNGHAEVLKSLGRLEESLAAYAEVMVSHPEDVVAKTGHAEVLKSLGRLEESLSAYAAVMASHPENVVAKTGHAEVLKSLGRLEEAQSAYEAIRARLPGDHVARNGLVSVLMLRGSWDEALAALPTADPTDLASWIAFHMRGMIYLRTNRQEDAAEIFQRGVEECPFAESQEFFKRALALALLQRQRSKEALEWARQCDVASLPTNVILFQAAGRERETRLANESYGRVLQFPNADRELCDELHRRYILEEPPEHDDEWVFERSWRLVAVA